MSFLHGALSLRWSRSRRADVSEFAAEGCNPAGLYFWSVGGDADGRAWEAESTMRLQTGKENSTCSDGYT